MPAEKILWKKDGITYFLKPGRSPFVYVKFWIGSGGKRRRTVRSTETEFSQGSQRAVEEIAEKLRAAEISSDAKQKHFDTSPTLSTWALRHKKYLESRKRHKDHIKAYVSRWLHAVKFFGMDKEIHSLTTSDIKDYVQHCYDTTSWSGDTINRALKVLKWAHREAIDRGEPVQKISWPKLDLGTKNTARAGKLIDDVTFRRLHSAVNSNCQDWLAFLLSTGLRKEESLRVRWADLDLESGWLHLPPESSKIKVARDIPLGPKLVTMLKERKQEIASVLVFPESPTRSISRARNRLNIRCTPRDLRHTFLTRLAESGADLKTLSSIAGWKSPEMAQIYLHAVKSRLVHYVHRATSKVPQRSVSQKRTPRVSTELQTGIEPVASGSGGQQDTSDTNDSNKLPNEECDTFTPLLTELVPHWVPH